MCLLWLTIINSPHHEATNYKSHKTYFSLSFLFLLFLTLFGKLTKATFTKDNNKFIKKPCNLYAKLMERILNAQKKFHLISKSNFYFYWTENPTAHAHTWKIQLQTKFMYMVIDFETSHSINKFHFPQFHLHVERDSRVKDIKHKTRKFQF